MMGIGYSEMLLILVVALIVLGPDKLPELGRVLGKTMRALRGVQDDFTLRLRESTQFPSTENASSDSATHQSADEMKTKPSVPAENPS